METVFRLGIITQVFQYQVNALTVLAAEVMPAVLHNAKRCDFRKECGDRIQYGILVYSSSEERRQGLEVF